MRARAFARKRNHDIYREVKEMEFEINRDLEILARKINDLRDSL